MYKNKSFKISHKIIWLSSLCLGILTAVPKIAEHHFVFYEALADSTVTALFSVLIWYFNMFALPAYSARNSVESFSTKRLIAGLCFGLVLMFILALIQQYLLSHLNFGPVMLMFEVRGVLITLTFYMLIHLLHQSYLNQQVSVELERSTTANLWAQHELLKQQINPHFLFNSLNTLKYMVETGDGQSVNFILKLSDFYRYTLERRKSDLIPLTEELEILQAYLFLLKARFEEGIELSQTIDPDVYQSRIPPFTLQILIENCIKHNIVSLDKPLHISLSTAHGYLIVKNRKQLKKTAETSTGLGLANINERYLLLSGKEIEILSAETTFTIKLPVIYENNYHRR